MHRRTPILRLLSLAVAGLLAAAAAGAQMSAEDLKRKIQERSKRIDEFRTLLNDPDQNTRLAALDVMLNSDDLAMREVAFGTCFNSAEQAMRVLCLKNKLAQMKTVAVTIEDESEWSKSEAKALKDWGGRYVFEMATIDKNTGQFTTRGSHRKGKGQITGTRVEFEQRFCNGSFRLVDGAVLEGELGCTSSWSGTFPARILLQ